MTDRPIIFSAPMVRALLENRKTQTRRIVRDVPPQPETRCHPEIEQRHPAPYLDSYCSERRSAANPRGMSMHWCWWQVDDRQCLPSFRVPFVPGDRLWVRETWRPDPNGNEADGRISIFYPAGYVSRTLYPDYGWKSPKQAQNGKVTPLHMPRWASRLTLTVTDVRVQRLQDISEEDAKAEGWPGPVTEVGFPIIGPVGWFQGIWWTIHGVESWEANPWVAALTFTVEQRNIDEAAR